VPDAVVFSVKYNPKDKYSREAARCWALNGALKASGLSRVERQDLCADYRAKKRVYEQRAVSHQRVKEARLLLAVVDGV